MNCQMNLLSWPRSGSHLIAITRGLVGTQEFNEIFAQVAQMTRPLVDCKVLIDLEDASYRLEPADIRCIISELQPELWPQNIKIALITAATTTQYDQLLTLSSYLSKLGFKTGVFSGMKVAVNWLSEGSPLF